MQAVAQCKQLLQEALVVIKEIPHDVGRSAPPAVRPPAAAPTVPREQVVSARAPPISTTKGVRRGSATNEVGGAPVPEPHFRRPQKSTRTRRCGKCGQTGHYSSTCGRKAPPPKRPRGRPVVIGKGKVGTACHEDD